LISQGAKLVSRFEDVLEDMPPSCFQEESNTPKLNSFVPDFPRALSLSKRKILQFIGSRSLALEEIASGCGLDFSSLSSALFELEIDGLIISEPGQHYAIKKRN
jgi:predicted Rossmann fold nucleotide-binding protein DprA/Smf involved in DNA uptake